MERVLQEGDCLSASSVGNPSERTLQFSIGLKRPHCRRWWVQPVSRHVIRCKKIADGARELACGRNLDGLFVGANEVSNSKQSRDAIIHALTNHKWAPTW